MAGAWLLDALGHGFCGVWFCREGRPAAALVAADRLLAQGKVPVKTLLISEPIACCRYGAERQPAYYLFRPDQHVVARWRAL